MSSRGRVKRTPPTAPIPPGSSDYPPLVQIEADPLCDVMTSLNTPQVRRNAVDPAAPKVVRSVPENIAVGTPKGCSRGSFKRLALDVLDRSDLDDPSTLSEILSLVKKLVVDNSALKNELAEVKQLLNNILGSTSSIAPIQKPTISYASVTKAKNVVVINPSSDKLNAEDSRQIIKSKLNPAHYNLSGISTTKKGGVVVECPSSAERAKFKSDAVAQLGDDFVVSAPKGRHPRVRIFGLSNQLNAIDIVQALKAQNESIFAETCVVSVAHIYKGRSSPLFGAKLEVDAVTFNRLIDAEKVFIGWDICYVSEDMNIRRCFKCWGFTHVASNCSSTQRRCPKCAGNHHQNECDSSEEKCVVCCDAVSKFHLNVNTNHNVFSSDCPSFIHRVALQRKNTDYGK